MNVLLISDIHSNLAALEAVIRDAEVRFDISETWVLGDLVGYGPNPKECIELLSNMKNIEVVMGNHDAAVDRKSVV